ncbi:hypothetical protein M441DRAFT_213491 [Trichoderma asperellum CBS 433.97]|uniref:Uncharacterized protein n=1 Tax=Trichoderma asperellum (strain ATCC 204424 / CBS 433.97 / NBRC 101777) TaxID=1042311 RepID=A0A2T3ZNH6_TRIA4|nr:hypothetical protein M441DRAFT_213491 [Trichoderma asperellum CBS 433.97]PTB46334.1 hypothetical protein M441DRAFT_213491 [Trichoderma asperellum CBS 433.97]
MPCTIFGCGGACAIAAKAASQRRHKTRNGNKGSTRGGLDLALPRRAQAPFCRVPFRLEQLTYGIAVAIPEERQIPLLNKKDMSQ